MTIHVKNGSIDTSISRRGFVAGSGWADLRLHARRSRPRRRGARRDAADQVQCLRQHRRRQHHHHRLPGRRNGAGRVHVIAADPGGRARRRLVESEGRVRAGQSEGLRQLSSAVPRCADHRGQRRGGRLFHAVAHGRRAGAQGAARCRRRQMESAGGRTDHRQEHDHSQEVRPQDQLWRGRGLRDSAGRAAEDRRKPISRSRRSSS